MPLLIRNAEIVTADSRFRGDIYAEGETNTRNGTRLDAPPDAEIIDATGKLVFPGFIDPHVHIYLPFMATFAKDTHETGSIAALVGGTTTFIEMCCPSRLDDALEGYHLWKSKAAGSSACDYSFHMSVTKFEDQTEGQLRARDRRRRHRVFQNLPGVQEFLRCRRCRDVPDAATGPQAGCDRHGTLRKRRADRPLATAPAVRRQEGPEWHESRPAGLSRWRRKARIASLRSFKTPARPATLCIFHRRGSVTGSGGRQVRAGSPYLGGIGASSPFARARLTRRGRASRGMKHVMSPPPLRDRRNQTILWDALAAGCRRLPSRPDHVVRSIPHAETFGQGCVRANPQWHSEGD